ncbi:MAG: LPS export ABC transporter periplasmic protein LptC [Cellvibrionales bacterium]|nr:LPS export ABC transporter periplasmic protein LptC [Cellvibrionales bacterium]
MPNAGAGAVKTEGRRLFVVLIFVPLALVAFFWDFGGDLEQSLPQGEQPAIALEQVRLTQFDGAGQRALRIESAVLSAQELGGVIDIESPVIEVEAHGSSWRILSQSGQFDQAAGRLRLSGAVRLTRQSGAAVEMRTERLDYYPQTRRAHTDLLVRIEAQGHRVDSDGVQLDLLNSIYRLSANVRGQHASF